MGRGSESSLLACLKPNTGKYKNSLRNVEWREAKFRKLKNLRMYSICKRVGPDKKIRQRSRTVKFVGYAQNVYRLWDSVKRKIIISREVHFLEDENEPIIEENKRKNFKETKQGKICIEEDSSSEEEILNIDDDIVIAKNDSDDDIVIVENDSAEEDDEKDMTLEQTKQIVRRSQRDKKFPDRYNTYAYLTYEDVINTRDKKKWIEAMKEEMDSLNKNETWDLINISEINKKNCLSSRWVFQMKENGKYKARLIARGCEQKVNIDYDRLYSPVVDSATLRMLFALAAHNDWNYIKFDVKTAFLYGE